MTDYQRAIEIIFKGNFEVSKIALRLAQEHPSIFVKLATEKPEDDWIVAGVKKVLGNNHQANYVSAVKWHRQNTGSSLRDSVDFVKQYRNY